MYRDDLATALELVLYWNGVRYSDKSHNSSPTVMLNLWERIDGSRTTKPYPLANVEVHTQPPKIERTFDSIMVGTDG
jgi:hypothetical protein